MYRFTVQVKEEHGVSDVVASATCQLELTRDDNDAAVHVRRGVKEALVTAGLPQRVFELDILHTDRG